MEPEGAMAITREVREKFCDASAGTLWERLQERESVQNAQAWRFLDGFLTEPFIVFFEPSDDESAILLEPCGRFSEMLGECNGFVFYITDPGVTYALCFNDHDFLIGVGNASKFVARMKQVWDSAVR